MPDTPRYRNWHKATRSNQGNGCVEVSFDVAGMVAVRDSKLGDRSPILEFTDFEFECFADGVLKGEFRKPS